MEDMILTSERESLDHDANKSLDSHSGMMQKQLFNDNQNEKSNLKLDRAKRSAIEIENISKNVMVDLESQTQKLHSTQLKIGNLNTSIDNSGNLITRIMNREHRNKAIIGVFSVTLVALFIMIMYTKSA